MKPEELYKKEFGDAESIPKESVIRLLNHFAKALKMERQAVKNNAVLPLVSGSTAKMQFFDEAIKAKRHIAAFHFNDVFLEFADKFYLGKSHKITIANFKKWMQLAAKRHGLKIVIAKVDQIDRVDFGVRNIWSIPDIEYCH